MPKHSWHLYAEQDAFHSFDFPLYYKKHRSTLQNEKLSYQTMILSQLLRCLPSKLLSQETLTEEKFLAHWVIWHIKGNQILFTYNHGPLKICGVTGYIEKQNLEDFFRIKQFQHTFAKINTKLLKQKLENAF